MPLLRPERPAVEVERARASRPRKSSRVETMGRALRGILVRGMMATQMTMKIESQAGY